VLPIRRAGLAGGAGTAVAVAGAGAPALAQAAAQAREGAPAPGTAPMRDLVPVLLIGSTPTNPLSTYSPPGRSYSPCARCLNCACRVQKNFTGAQASSPIRFPFRNRSSSARPSTRLQRHTRSPSPGPPLLGRKAPQDEGPTDMPSWDEAQATYSLGAEAMSQGSTGSPVLFLDPAACEDILADLRGEDGLLPSFSDSEPGSPPPLLESEVTHHTRTSQTPTVRYRDCSTSAPLPLSFDQVTSTLPHVATLDQSTQVDSRPHRATSACQTTSPSSSDPGVGPG